MRTSDPRVLFGTRVRELRAERGLSQERLAELAKLHRNYVGGVERGERNLTFSSLCQICSGLNCDIAAVTKGIPYGTDAPKIARKR